MFNYNSNRGLDFFNVITEDRVEFTTYKAYQAHLKRYQKDYPDLEMVLYKLPKSKF